MNKDIISEILRHLYLFIPDKNGGVSLAEKIILSTKKFRNLRKRKIEKPIIFSVKGTEVSIKAYFKDATIYWGDGSIYCSGDFPKLVDHKHTYPQDQVWTVRIFNHRRKITLSKNTTKVYSIGNMYDLSGMFRYLQSEYDPSFAKIDTSKVTNMSWMFCGCMNLDKNIGKYWDTSNVVDMSNMFRGCLNLNKNIGKYWNTSRVRNMKYMFAHCYKLNTNVGRNWNVGNVVDMSGMFDSCVNLDQNIGLKWNTSNVVKMDSMFDRCYRINKPIGKNWNTSKVMFMWGMFSHCLHLDDFVGQNWDTSKVTRMDHMFDGCIKLTKFGGKNWDISNLISVDYMFYNCSYIDKNSIDWNISKIKNKRSVFG
jgi:hypothetical protein